MPSPEPARWADQIAQPDWDLYQAVLSAAQEAKIPFALGGGMAFSYYARRWRDTKDIDLYIRPRDRQRMIDVITAAGFHDLFAEHDYDRNWIFRARNQQVICDTMWAMANQRGTVDDAWLRRGPQLRVHDLTLRLLPVEELIWAKLYVVQRERCDWPDLLNILHIQAPRLDWEYLLARVGPDARVLGGLMSLLAWMCPDQAAKLPQWIWAPLGLRGPQPADSGDCAPRAKLLDSRPWFGPTE